MRKSCLGLCLIMLVGIMVLLPVMAGAASFPDKDMELVVAYKPGGGSDTTARMFAKFANKYLSKPLVIVNYPGGGGAIGQQRGALAKADGYTLTLVTTSLTIHPLIKKVAYDYTSFIPIAQITDVPDILMVRKNDEDLNSAEKFLAYAKGNPHAITIATSGVGSTDNFTAMMLQEKGGISITLVPYGAEAKVGLLGGHVSAAVGGPEDVMDLPDLKAIMVFSDERIAELPDVPTAKELGIDWVSSVWRGIAVPKGTPAEAVAYLKDISKKTMSDQDMQKTMSDLGLGMKYADGDAFAEKIKNQADTYKRLMGK